MLYLTERGNEDIKKAYPDNISFTRACLISLSQFLYCYVVLALVMMMVYRDVMTISPYYYLINIASISVIVTIIVNVALTTMTTHKCTGKGTGSFKSVIMKGKYKLGLFVRGSCLRHVVMNPLLDAINYTTMLVVVMVVTDMPDSIVEPMDILVSFIGFLILEMFFGVLRVIVIRNGDIWSREIVVGWACCKPNIEDSTTRDEMPQDEPFVETQVTQDEPYYKSFVV